jgi:hypothetical protein
MSVETLFKLPHIRTHRGPVHLRMIFLHPDYNHYEQADQ